MGFLPAVLLHVFGDRDADEFADSTETEERLITSGGFDSASRTDVNEHLRAPAEELTPKTENLARASCTYGVTDIAVDEAGVL